MGVSGTTWLDRSSSPAPEPPSPSSPSRSRRSPAIAAKEAGLASGLLNTSQQIGGAIGVAIASTVAATHFKTLVDSGSAAVPITFLLVRSRDLAAAAPAEATLSIDSTQREAA